MKAELHAAADDELLIIRAFDAPVARVFDIWADAAARRKWWGPKSHTCTGLEQDFRPGGAWRACITSQEGVDSWMSGVFREIETNRRIVFTFRWENGGNGGLESIITVAFAERGGKTVQSFHQQSFVDVASRDSHVGGWTSCIDHEEDYLAREPAQ